MSHARRLLSITSLLSFAVALASCAQSTNAASTSSGDDAGTLGGDDATLGSDDTGTAANDTGSAGTDTGTATDTGPAGAALRFTVFGDSRDGYAVHQKLLDRMSKSNPQLVLDTGDLWAGYPNGSSQWRTITQSNSNIAALLASNLYLVSRGNHESSSELLAFQPTLVRGGTETYSFKLGNAFFVSAGMDPSLAATSIKTALSSADAKSATWRFVYSHYPIYDSGDGHGPIEGVPSVEALCDTYHVTAFFTGHEHIYERFNQIKAGSVVDTSDAMTASKGTVYLVSGGGGAPFYSVTSPLPESHVHVTNVNHFVVVDLTSTTMSAKVLDVNGAVLDQFTVHQ